MNSNSKKISKFIVCLQLMSFMLMCYYVYHSNKTATSWYILENLQERRDGLLNHQEMLNLKISRVQSMDSIESDPYIQEMQSYPTNPHYIDWKISQWSNLN